MSVKRAAIERSQRYDRWYELLLLELDLVAKPGANVFAVGDKVEDQLTRHPFPRSFTTLFHYSPVNVAHRKKRMAGHEADFEEFKSSLSIDRVLATAKEV